MRKRHDTEIAAHSPPRLDRWSVTQARTALVLLVVSIVALVGLSVSPFRVNYAASPGRGGSDIKLYLAEIERIRHGEPYYVAASRELRARGYPSASVFNWRTPLPMALVAALESNLYGKLVLCGLALGVIVLTLVVMSRDARPQRGAGAAILVFGAVMFVFLGDSFAMPSLWAGVLIALSLLMFGVGRPFLAVACGMGAAFCRDLAAPYCGLSLVIALCRGRRKEATAWCAGLALYGMFFLWHINQVALFVNAADAAHEDGWLQFGGLPFVLSIVQLHGFLINLPQWVAAVYLPLAVLGLASWSTPVGRRVLLTTTGYLLGFCFIGNDFNQYWGVLVAPLLALGVARAPAAIVELCRAGRLWRPTLAPAKAA